jgi:3',5'-cyclic-AMP phosphodiesterase
MRFAWLTDVHLNSLRPPGVEAFSAMLAETECDAFLWSGDIGEADDVCHLLNALDTAVQRPVYFVLGNHDFYRGSIAGVRETVQQLCAVCPDLHRLPGWCR